MSSSLIQAHCVFCFVLFGLVSLHGVQCKCTVPIYCTGTYQVVLNARSEDKLKGATDEIKASGGDVAIAVGDVSKVNKAPV